jgi:peptide/nickel transport system permease protein
MATLTAPLRLRSTGPRRYGDPLLLISATLATGLVVLAVIGPWITPYDPAATDILAASQGPSGAHLFGTDSLGCWRSPQPGTAAGSTGC